MGRRSRQNYITNNHDVAIPKCSISRQISTILIRILIRIDCSLSLDTRDFEHSEQLIVHDQNHCPNRSARRLLLHVGTQAKEITELAP